MSDSDECISKWHGVVPKEAELDEWRLELDCFNTFQSVSFNLFQYVWISAQNLMSPKSPKGARAFTARVWLATTMVSLPSSPGSRRPQRPLALGDTFGGFLLSFIFVVGCKLFGDCSFRNETWCYRPESENLGNQTRTDQHSPGAIVDLRHEQRHHLAIDPGQEEEGIFPYSAIFSHPKPLGFLGFILYIQCTVHSISMIYGPWSAGFAECKTRSP